MQAKQDLGLAVKQKDNIEKELSMTELVEALVEEFKKKISKGISTFTETQEPTRGKESLENSRNEQSRNSIIQIPEDFKVKPSEDLGKEVSEPIRDLKENIYEPGLVENGPKENDPEPTKKLKEMVKPGSSNLDEDKESQALPIEEVQDQIAIEQPQDLSLEDSSGSLLKDPCQGLPSSRNTQPASIDQCQTFRVIPDNLGLLIVSPKISQGFTSYFLPLPDPFHISKAMELHFSEIIRMHETLESIPFATYFWYTLWNLLGVHDKFSCSCRTRVKPREPVVQ